LMPSDNVRKHFCNYERIMHYQGEYFLDGDETKLKPMILKTLQILGRPWHLDCFSLANSKYVETPYGTKLIKEFFSKRWKRSGRDAFHTWIKKYCRTSLKRTKKPLPDDQLAGTKKRLSYRQKNHCKIQRSSLIFL
jgi:RNA polymerase sigma-54 factor